MINTYKKRPVSLDKVSPECLPLVQKIEELLYLRRAERSSSKKWSQAEFCRYAYSSYKSMLAGKVRYLPHRSTIMEIADYLECTLTERNTLLVAAHYLPIPASLEGDDLERALSIGYQTLEMLPLPAMMIDRDWHIKAVNQKLPETFGLTGNDFEAIPLQQRNVLQLIFDPDLPLRKRISVSTGAWAEIAYSNLQGFRRDTFLSQHEPWYHALLARLLLLPDFEECWNAVCKDDTQSLLFCNAPVLGPNNLPLRVASLWIHLGRFAYPQIVAYAPADQLGIKRIVQQPENRSEQQVSMSQDLLSDILCSNGFALPQEV